jgi:hypothetical protein
LCMCGKLAALLTPPSSVDTVILLRQNTLWPPWRFAVRHNPEIVDFRLQYFQQGKSKRSSQQIAQFISADAAGRTPCPVGPSAQVCLACNTFVHALCRCLSGGSKYALSQSLDAFHMRRCCLRAMHPTTSHALSV